VNTSPLSMADLRQAVTDMPADVLTPTRQLALEHIEKHGLPTTGHEDWKYTDLSPVIDISNRWLAGRPDQYAAKSLHAEAAAICRSIDAHWLIIANGIVDHDSVQAAETAGINVTLLSQQDVNINVEAPLANLNTALLRDGLCVSVDRNTALKKPIGLMLIDDSESGRAVTQSRIEIDLSANSESQFIEMHASTGRSEHYANSVIELKLGSGARCEVVRVQDRSLLHSQTARFSAALKQDSHLHYSGFDLGGKLTRNDLGVEILGPGASAQFDGLYLAGEGQHIDNHTRVDHRVGPANSKQEYRGILSGSCQCVWNGKAIVHAGADGTDAQQQNHNLLLTERSEIDAKPELEIYADDVKCSHGTTVGQLDESAIYYLRSRGIDEQQATQILTRAFAGSVVNKLSIAALHETIAEMVESRLKAIVDKGQS
jgi:Fe-S cluster assembly protein SufD